MSKKDEQIKKAAREYAESESGLDYIGEVAVEKAFKAGVIFALSHQWRSVEDALPPYDTDIIGMENESVYLCKRERMFDGEDVYIINDAGCFHPTHWMPIPPLPEARKEGEEC